MRTTPGGGTRVAAVMAAYNRRDLTLACLRSLRAQQVADITLDVFVLDDASSDGTSEAIAEQFPEVTVLHGDGHLYWNGGMRRAFGAAIARDYDYYLWMNDDTVLDDRGLAVLLDTARHLRECGDEAVIVAGSTRHPDTGELTYGGVVHPHRWRPLRSELVEPGDAPRPCDTMNGNATLISRTVVRRIGNLDPAFVQQMGDFDYGLRARAAGCSVWVAPGTVGTCASNPVRRTDERPLAEELRRIWSLKELKPGPWAVYSRRWAGKLWPMYWLSPYLHGGIRLVLQRIPLARRDARSNPEAIAFWPARFGSRLDKSMRLRPQDMQHQDPRVLWVSMDDTAPHPYLVASLRQAGLTVRDLHWAMSENGQRSFGRYVEFGDRTGQEHPMSVKLVSPRMFLELAGAPEDVLIIYELGLIGLYAGLSKLFRPHKVVSLVEGDYRHIGRAGTAPPKVMARRLAARFIDVFVANNPPAREYLIRTLDVPEDKIIVGWWLAGMPTDLAAHPLAAVPVPEGSPLFVCAGRLIPQKGTDLVIRALSVYRRQFGSCALWVIGEGPERESLVQLSSRLEVEDMVTFLGMVDHHVLKGAFQACQAFVFPTLQDFVGRVVVEALSAGAPVVVSPMTGAVGTIVHDGVNGIVVDPRNASALAEAMHRAADPDTSRALRAGVQQTSAALKPEAVAEVLLSAVARAQGGHAVEDVR